MSENNEERAKKQKEDIEKMIAEATKINVAPEEIPGKEGKGAKPYSMGFDNPKKKDKRVLSWGFLSRKHEDISGSYIAEADVRAIIASIQSSASYIVPVDSSKPVPVKPGTTKDSEKKKNFFKKAIAAGAILLVLIPLISSCNAKTKDIPAGETKIVYMEKEKTITDLIKEYQGEISAITNQTIPALIENEQSSSIKTLLEADNAGIPKEGKGDIKPILGEKDVESRVLERNNKAEELKENVDTLINEYNDNMTDNEKTEYFNKLIDLGYDVVEFSTELANSNIEIQGNFILVSNMHQQQIDPNNESAMKRHEAEQEVASDMIAILKDGVKSNNQIVNDTLTYEETIKPNIEENEIGG